MAGALSSSFINNSLFEMNMVNGSGGAVYLVDCNLYVFNNTFKNNEAPIGGAIRYLDRLPPFMSDPSMLIDSCGSRGKNLCSGNVQTVFGRNIASYPKSIAIEGIQNLNLEYTI